MNEDFLPPLLSETPIAYYRLDAHDNLVAANPAWLELHGYPFLDEVLGKNIQFVYVDPLQAKVIRENIISNGNVKDKIFELKRSNGERFWGSVFARKITDENGNYDGREGFIVDATERFIHERIIKHIPIGYYAVDTIDGEDKITYCNQEFANIFHAKSPSDIFGLDISELYLRRKDFESFRVRASQTAGVIRHELDVQTIDKKRTFWMEAITRIQQNAQGEITGRVGVVRDLDEDKPLNRVRKNLGVVLHSFTTGFLVIRSDLEATTRALGSITPLAPEPNSHLRLLQEMKEPVAVLRHSLNDTLQKITVQKSNSDLFNILTELQGDLEYAEQTDEVFRIHNLRSTAEKVVEVSQTSLTRHESARQPLKQLRQNAYEVLQVFARYRLSERIADVLDMEYTLRSLRRYLTTPFQDASRTPSPVNFWQIILESMRNLHDFAASKSVKFKPPSHIPRNTTVMVNPKEMARAISNLLHNAIKYSWFRDTGTWVDISLTESNEILSLQITNYGVPIAEDEIEKGLIYKFGFRSRLSSDRGRIGTGIGLPDALEIIERYSGNLNIDSRPASPGGNIANKNPFLTTALVTIPIHKVKK